MRRIREERWPEPVWSARQKPHLFLLQWDNSATQNAFGPNRFARHEAWGTHYPTGTTTLDYGAAYESLQELIDHVSQAGRYQISWFEEEEESYEQES